MLKTIITTQRPQNIGQAVINHLTSIGVYGKVSINTIDTKRNCSTRTTTVTYSPKASK